DAEMRTDMIDGIWRIFPRRYRPQATVKRGFTRTSVGRSVDARRAGWASPLARLHAITAGVSVRQAACFVCRGYIRLTRENPSAVHVSGDHRQNDRADHCNQGCDDRSTITTDASE